MAVTSWRIAAGAATSWSCPPGWPKTAPVVPTGDPHELYRSMRLIRRFEERVVDLVNANEIAGVTHESVGQEAVAVGVCSVLRRDDVITSTHRGHGHLLAKGADVNAKTNRGDDALSVAKEHADVRALLLQAGAKP